MRRKGRLPKYQSDSRRTGKRKNADLRKKRLAEGRRGTLVGNRTKKRRKRKTQEEGGKSPGPMFGTKTKRLKTKGLSAVLRKTASVIANKNRDRRRRSSHGPKEPGKTLRRRSSPGGARRSSSRRGPRRVAKRRGGVQEEIAHQKKQEDRLHGGNAFQPGRRVLGGRGVPMRRQSKASKGHAARGLFHGDFFGKKAAEFRGAGRRRSEHERISENGKEKRRLACTRRDVETIQSTLAAKPPWDENSRSVVCGRGRTKRCLAQRTWAYMPGGNSPHTTGKNKTGRGNERGRKASDKHQYVSELITIQLGVPKKEAESFKLFYD